MTINDNDLLFGWNRHEEIYQAFKHPLDDHSELIADILMFMSTRPTLDYLKHEVLVPMGYLGNQDIIVNPRFGQSERLTKSNQFKAYIKQSGVYEYWQEHGYPPQCRPLPNSDITDDFECDKYPLK